MSLLNYGHAVGILWARALGWSVATVPGGARQLIFRTKKPGVFSN